MTSETLSALKADLQNIGEKPKNTNAPRAEQTFEQKIATAANGAPERFAEDAREKARNVRELEEAIQKQLEMPSPAEIDKAFKGGTNETKLAIETALIYRAFALAENPDMNLGKAIEFDEVGPDFDTNKVENKPTIF
jgi:hypothetical protein